MFSYNSVYLIFVLHIATTLAWSNHFWPRYPSSDRYGSGTGYSSTFDFRDDIFKEAQVTSIQCRAGARLDYVNVKYDTYASPGYFSNGISFGNPTGGNDQGTVEIYDVLAITVHVCHGKREGLICGLHIEYRDEFVGNKSYTCGVLNPDGEQRRFVFGEDKTFHSFFGTTKDSGKVITSIGWAWYKPDK